jgi:hypothetical protein
MLIALAIAAAVSAEPPAAAADLLAALGDIEAIPGAWAEYLVRAAEGDVRVRVTALAAHDEERYWLELAIAGSSGVAGAARVLVRRGEPPRLESVYAMVAGLQPVEIPMGRLARQRNAMPLRHASRARVRCRAGTFSTEVLSAPAIRVWRASGVPLWGVVKARGRTASIELVAFGMRGGHSLFPRGWLEQGDHGKGNDRAK